MPTGYTNAIKDGISFEVFILHCARAFGALVTMRDDSSDAEIPESFQPTDYHQKHIQTINEKLSALDVISPEEVVSEAWRKYDKETQYKKNRIRDANNLRAKYAEMLLQVKLWNPPTPDHKGLKEFMVKQIEESVDFDCDTSYYLKKKPTLLTGQQWIEGERDKLLFELDYHTKEDIKEKERVANRNAWVKALRDSLAKA